MSDQEVAIVSMATDHVAQVAALHQTGIHTGFLSSLGPRFLKQLYKAIPAASSGFVFVGVRGQDVLGFVACTELLGGLYKQALKKRGLAMGLALVPRAFRPSVFKRIIETLFYPSKIADDFPKAEVLSIVVDESMRGKKLASQLIARAVAEFRSRGIRKVKVLVWDQNLAAKRFYEKCGFLLAGHCPHHEEVLDVYVMTIDREGEADSRESAMDG